MRYITAYYTHKGLRGYQQDCLFVNGKIIQKDYMNFPEFEKIEKDFSLFAVCDGMGGLLHGEKASRFVCDRLKEKISFAEFSPQWINKILAEIQQDFVQSYIKNSGTTVAGVFLKSQNSIIFNVGDSRVYKLTKYGIEYISHDHSVVQELLDEGQLSQEEAFYHPYKHIVTFGIGDVFDSDWRGNKKPFIKEDFLNDDEYYLICTDGVNDVLKDQQIYKALWPDPFKKVSEFIETIKKYMSDNFSFIIISIEKSL